MLKEEPKYKIGDLIKVIYPKGCGCLGTCVGNIKEENCRGYTGIIKDVYLDKRDRYRYRYDYSIILFKKENVNTRAVRCGFKEEDIRLTTQEEHDRFFLMKYRDV